MRDSEPVGKLVGQSLGKYKLLALIASGGTAEIYLARIGGAAGFEKYVVVKVLLNHLADDLEFSKMFADEARLGAQLDHSNIVKSLEFGKEEGRYYLVMEYLAGMSLAKLNRKTKECTPEKRLPTEIILFLAAQACEGLHYAHQKSMLGKKINLIHRDISPQNLVVTFEGILKIVDFGIAMTDVRETQTQIGTIKGKFAYMSPEQCQAKELDHRTDIFALGTICHELLTGQRLFKRLDGYETHQAILADDVPPPSSINPDLGEDIDDVILKALAFRKKDRYKSAQVFGEALLRLLNSRGKATSFSDVAQYIEKKLPDEVSDHANAMRRIVQGEQDFSADMSWDDIDQIVVESDQIVSGDRLTRELDPEEAQLSSQSSESDDEAPTRIRLFDSDLSVDQPSQTEDSYSSTVVNESFLSRDKRDLTHPEPVKVPTLDLRDKSEDPATVPEPSPAVLDIKTPTLKGTKAANESDLFNPDRLPFVARPSPNPDDLDPKTLPSHRTHPISDPGTGDVRHSQSSPGFVASTEASEESRNRLKSNRGLGAESKVQSTESLKPALVLFVLSFIIGILLAFLFGSSL